MGSDGPTLQDLYMRKIQVQLDVIESIREDLTTEGISVPGVVVVGAQSAGKSSVLESMSGIQLPRGDTITTRVPLLLRLENNPALPEGEFKTFISKHANMSGAEEITFDKIADKVQEYTVELAGEGGGVSDCPIHLKVQRKDSPNLTLIDLPGIAYNTADENLSGDIATMTKALINKYIESANMIIVVVVPAADDFASHESIKIASHHDMEGVRTLGVVTKTDRIETGAGFLAKMRAEGKGHIKLKLGFVAVKNRNQEEVDSSLSLDDARRREREFFETDARMRGLDRELWGMDTVVARIVEIQSEKLSEFIPMARKLVMQRIHESEQAIAKLPPTFQSVLERRAFFTDLVQKLVTKFKDLATTRDIPSAEGSHLAVASKTYEMYRGFSSELKNSVPDFLGDEYRNKLEEMVRLCKGGSLSNFLSHPIFVSCVKEGFVEPLTHHSKYLVEETHDYIVQTFRSLLEVKGGKTVRADAIPEMAASGVQLRQAIMQETLEFLKAREEMCQAHLHTRNQAEEFILTMDDLYGKTIEDLKSDGEREHGKWDFVRMFVSSITDAFVDTFRQGNNEVKALCELQASLKAYVRIRSRCADDDVAKIARHFLVRLPMDDLPKHIYSSMSDDRLADLMAEDPGVARERAKLDASLERCKRAREDLRALV